MILVWTWPKRLTSNNMYWGWGKILLLYKFSHIWNNLRSWAYGGLSSNWLRRPFSLVKLHRDQTLFFPLSYRERVGFILLVISQNFNDSALITLLLCSHCVASKFAELFLLVNSTFSTFPGGSQLPMLKMLFS